ncbi:DUF2141 domain-containing protein [Nitrospirillum pindoramense]|uniref:Uncharacterized protein (DUF2141 family) n=1 Tax=Nitrospirillum amazonense TaxID=28077 RepID=A0A560GKP4_9PROT|nr:DUF2141 domain-containing protein [Nitrospirillum amazonense]TWB34546.1 uncharacterized protein (DUF2141 family) [Nitrospirillum amazonense]
MTLTKHAIAAFLGALFVHAAAAAGDLTVTVEGIEPGPGAVRVVLYDKADGFRHEDKAAAVQSVPATQASVTAAFLNLPPGQYAVIAYHDANGNGKLDLTLGMFPSEGWGLSLDPTVLGPPRFGASAFDVGADPVFQTVRLHY